MTIRSILRPHFANPFKLTRMVPYLPQFIRLFYRLMNDARVSFFTKLVPVLGLIILISPPMLEQDFIPFLGELDSVLVVYFTLKIFIWLCPPEVVREHVARIGRNS
jgi:hypothetical protein